MTEKDGTPNLLIDDTPKKVNAFREHGGLAILHTTGDYETTIQEFLKYGREPSRKTPST